MATTLESQLQQILNDALASSGSMSATELTQIALRVAVLRDDPLAEAWLRIELEGVSSGRKKSPEVSETHVRLAAMVGTDNARKQLQDSAEAMITRRSIPGDEEGMTQAQGIAELESLYKITQAVHDEPVTPGMTPIDTGLASMNRDKARATTTPLLMKQAMIIERIKHAAYSYLIQVESEILRGQSVPDSIAQGRSFVDANLATKAPEARSALAAAQERLAQGDSESLSHAATSCRRALKALADALYPPGPPVLDDEGVSRTMDDERYRNRLVEYVRSNRGNSTHASLLASNIAVLGTRLKSLDDLASKGVHTGIHIAEAESCVTWTYMLAADLLRIKQEIDASSSD